MISVQRPQQLPKALIMVRACVGNWSVREIYQIFEIDVE